MTPGLNECLRAAGLQHYYARFTSVGVHHAAHLSALTIEDYPILGIHTMEDRTRLFHLVQMVKSLNLEALRYEDGDDYDIDGGDEGYALVDGSFTYGGYGDPDEDVYDGEDESRDTMNVSNEASVTRSSHVRRRLDFSCENTGHLQKLLSLHGCTSHDRNNHVQNKGSATPLQHDLDSGSAVYCRYKENHDHRKGGHSRQSNHHTGGNTKPNIIGGTATTLSPKLASFHKQKPRPATMASKRFDNKPGGHKDRKRISKKEIGHNGEIEHMTKPTLVYESKRTAGYNYGVPQSFHSASNKKFYFDKVFGEESSNEEVYQQTAYPLVQHMLNGGKATCFAYGQTGAGKTHTMLGSSPGRPGLYALAVRDIFAHLSSTRIYSALLVYVSCFEIYCGQLYDLLDHRKRLFAREDGQKVVHIAGLRNVRLKECIRSLDQEQSHTPFRQSKLTQGERVEGTGRTKRRTKK
ncbi:hypothetical protein INR49_015519 [Caranx melampygus]|nr:hypothetical protein INR49_015519 [Caranx melampygus]